MKRYEGLFILNTAGKEEGVKDVVDLLSKEITAGGGKVETVQKMDKRAFVRVADRKVTGGFYVNVIFATTPTALAALRTKLALNPEIFRVLFTAAPATPAPAPAPAA